MRPSLQTTVLVASNDFLTVARTRRYKKCGAARYPIEACVAHSGPKFQKMFKNFKCLNSTLFEHFWPNVQSFRNYKQFLNIFGIFGLLCGAVTTLKSVCKKMHTVAKKGLVTSFLQMQSTSSHA